jgi:hypothetical protein
MAGHFGTIRRTGVGPTGRVMKHTAETFWALVQRGADNVCWPYTGPRTPRGYGAITYRKKSWRAHRLAWTLTHGPIPKGQVVCHKCDNPPCCNPKCLFLGSNGDNTRDAQRKGRLASGDRHPTKVHGTAHLPRGADHHSKTQPACVARGERNGGAKISEATALAILKRRAETGLSAAKLAKEFLCGVGTVKHLLKGATWTYLPRPPRRRADRRARPGMPS